MAEKTDLELLQEYVAHGGESAFALLVSRHGPMVHRVCSRLLHDAHEARDAAQAVFVILSRKAPALRQQGTLAAWLYGVARNVCRHALRSRAQRARREEEGMAMQELERETAPACETRSAVMELVYGELRALSLLQQQAVILRYIEGRGEHEAATVAGCSVDALHRRATDGIGRLRQRLAQAGYAMDASAFVALLAAEAATAVPEALLSSILATVQGGAATGTAATGASTKVLWLAKDALKTLFWAKVKTAAVAAVLGIGVVGIGVAAHRVLASRTAPPPKPPAAVADAAGLRKLAPADAWLRDLLVRAETGPWEALDFQPGTILGDPGVWRADLRGAPGARRIWQTDSNAAAAVVFEKCRCQRGVVVGRVMLLPEGELPAGLAIPEPASKTVWTKKEDLGLELPGAGAPHGAYLVLFRQDFRENPKGAFTLVRGLDAASDPRGVWYRFAVYFDMTATGGAGAAWIAWPAARAGLPPAAAVGAGRKDFARLGGQAVGIGLMTKGVPALWEGVKLVPLGPDLASPPGGSEK